MDSRLRPAGACKRQGMRQSPRLVLCFVCFVGSLQVAVAQQSMVRITSLLLTEERDGWRASFPDGSPSKYSLRSGDLLTGIDSRSARLVGPLALTSAFNAAFSRSVPLTVRSPSHLPSTPRSADLSLSRCGEARKDWTSACGEGTGRFRRDIQPRKRRW